MEKLRAYLRSRKHSEFAERAGITGAYLSQLLSGQRKPSLDVMRQIHDATEGLVDLNSWYVKPETKEAAE